MGRVLAWCRVRTPRGERGSFALELALIAPVLIGLILFISAAGKVSEARGEMESFARDAARAASINHELGAGEAEQAARDAIEPIKGYKGMTCNLQGIVIPPIAPPPPGEPPESVEVTLQCNVDLMSGRLSKTLTVVGRSPVDKYRGRGGA